jgi:hypothetical protein
MSGHSKRPEILSDGHASLESLLELSLGELAPAAATPIAEHLRGCPDCFVRYASLLELPDPPLGGGGEEAAEAAAQAAAWRELRRVLGLGQTESRAEEPVQPAVLRGSFRGSLRETSVPWLGAAALVLLGFLGGYLARAGRDETLSPLLATASTAQLVPGDLPVRGNASQTVKVVCQPQDAFYSWGVTGLGSAARIGTPVEIEVEKPGGSSIRLRRLIQKFGEITLILPRRGLPNGDYVIRLHIAAGAAGREVDKEIRLTLDCP